ncbi:MAG: hypothetical protein FJ225_05325 [Lentisphaerae bacterium]|nr:hypothetical protein [Lentisphaerota bacterium]
MPADTLPEWERLLSSAAHLQKILPSAVMVGGSAAALHVGHRFSRDADHVLPELTRRFDEILAELESVAGWTTARVRRPVLILGSLDGIETGVRQLMRARPLDTVRLQCEGQPVTVPTMAEILRIKGVLILKRNATRDYLDFVALADAIGNAAVVEALRDFDELYPQPNGQSALQQLQIQLAKPLPYDLEGPKLDEYKDLIPRWREWSTVESVAAQLADLILDHL